MQCQPVVAHGVLYATSPRLRVFALDAATGAVKWSFNPNADAKTPSRTRIRGLMYWERGSDRRIYFGARHWLYALDATTGKPLPGFGVDGRIDLRQGFRERDPRAISVGVNTPGVFFGDLLILGSVVPEGLPSAPGDIRAFDVHTGAQKWTFHTIPHPGEFGYDTWPKDAWKYSGGANAGPACRSIERAGSCSSPPGRRPTTSTAATGTATTCSRTRSCASARDTGERVWHFQGVKHDVWDRDFPAAARARHDHAATAADRRRRADREERPHLRPRARDRRAALPDARGADAGLRRCRARRSRRRSCCRRCRRRSRGRVHRGSHHHAHAGGARGGAREVAALAQGRRVRSAERAGHGPLPGHGRRRRVGRRGLRPASPASST